ncbi:hypothetical protein PUN28_019005 [Cardiocondyla obscurior]|uniref:Putative zinc-finger domain-containing protein n=1 Tax=Cardiocondyla obscurior TaxID=286306 RepID=A0AAW2EED0_9HYME
MASDLSSGCTETIDILDDEKEEGEISLEDVSSSEEGGMGHLTSSYVVGRKRPCSACKSWGECTTWCNLAYHRKTRRDPVKGKENRHHVREAGNTAAKSTILTLQERNDDLVPISSDSDMEIVGLTDTSNRKAKVKKKKRKKKDYELLSIDELISPSSIELPAQDADTLKLREEVSSIHKSSGKSNYCRKVVLTSSTRKYRPVAPQTSRSSVNHSRSPAPKRSVRKARSPKRSPRRHSPARTTAKRPPPKPSLPSSTRSHDDRSCNVSRLLKKVKRLDPTGTHTSEPSVNRNKESSLKEKLSNMLRRASSDDHAVHLKKKSRAQPETINDADDEDDEALLRQKALETKQKKSHRSMDQLVDVELEKRSAASNDDHDEEALQLRMIALRSAVIKKHQNRVQRGIKAKRSARSESPFNSNFLDDIPVPGEELLRYPSPPCTPSCESNHIEDMDLDTDVEREKEKLPYSPTDKITENIPIDTALLGIEPSDVSFINVNETATSSVFEDTQEDFLIDSLASFYNKTYLPRQVPATQYFPPSEYGNETYHSNFNDPSVKRVKNSHDGIACDVINGISCQEGTYPSTGILSDTSNVPMSKNFFTPPISPHGTFAPSPQMQQIAEQPINDGTAFANVDSALRDDNLPYEIQPVSGYSATPELAMPASYTRGCDEPRSPNESIITIDDLPENNTDPFSPNIVLSGDKTAPDAEHIPKEAASRPTAAEPLYMQGVPDITKDRNKIPTLINRRLVPVPILKSNKLLQQHPKKKKTPPPGPAFKSAEMQPVTITLTDAGSNVFKPIKLQVAKKSVLPKPTTFHNLANEPPDEPENKELLPENDHEAIEAEHSEVLSANNETTLTRGKKRKRVKKNIRQNADGVPLLETANKSNSDAVNKDINIASTSVDRQSVTVSGKNDGNDMQDNLIENEKSVKLKSITDTEKTVNFSEAVVKNNSTEKNNNAVLPTSAECPDKRRSLQEEHTKEPHCLSTDLTSGNSNSTVADKAVEGSVTKCDNKRRQSIDEDEDELRAILLASLKRTKLTDNNCTAAPDSVKKSEVTVPPPASKTTAPMPSAISTTNNQALLPPTPSTSSKALSKTINDASVSVPNGIKKKTGTLDATKNPVKKVARKTLTSAKVVNNAKKYQNMIVQKKQLLLRKLDKNAAITKPSESTWLSAGASKTPHAFDTQRFVINLGESDTDTESEGETSSSVPEKPQAHQEVSADFEKNLNKFLRDVRTEQEQSAAATKSSTQAAKQDEPQIKKNSSNMPLAVRHLPVSQQEEYRRLKQVILEHEKLKLQRKMANNNSSSGGNSNSTNNKLLNVNVTKTTEKSVPPCDKKLQIKQDQNKLKMPDKSFQEVAAEVEKKNDDVCRTPAEKILPPNITKSTNVTSSQVKNGKKAIPNDLSIRISNVTTSSHNGAGRTIENLHDKQSAKDKQQLKPTLKVLTFNEINKKHVQVMLNSNTTERVVTINDKSVLQHDEPVVDENKSLAKADVSIEIINDKNLNNNDNDSNISTATTMQLHSSAESVVTQHEDVLDSTCSLSEYQAESHQQKIKRDISTSVLAENNDSANTSQSKSGLVSNDNISTNNVWNELKKNVKAELDSLTSLPKEEQEQYLRDTENKLVAKRYMLLDHLAEMSGNLRQWDMEEDVQIVLATEVKKLKEQLKIAEEKLQQQRDRVNSISPKVSVARRKINAGRQECSKLTKICSNLGNRLMGKTYKLPEAVAQLLANKFIEVANYTRQFAKKKNYSSDTSEVSYSSLFQETSELSKDMCTEENLSLQEKLLNNAISVDEVAGSKSDTSRSIQSNKNKSSSTTSDATAQFPQMILRQATPEKGETSINALNHCNKEPVSANQSSTSSSKSKLNQNNCVEQNNKHLKGNRTNKSDPVMSSKLKSSRRDSLNQECNKQSNKRASLQLPLSSSSSSPSPLISPSSVGSASVSTSTSRISTTTDTTMTDTTATNLTTTDTTTTNTTATKTISPYISILTHLKEPKNINPHGILCPYEMMGICRDESCQYIHLSSDLKN